MSRIRDLAKILTASTDVSTDAEVTSSIASHAAAADPHTVYLKESEFNSGGKNAIINGGFDIWQRGTSFTANTGYTADRWYKSAASGRTFSRQTTSDTTNLPNIQYCLRMQRDSGNTATDNVILSQSFESTNAIPYVGKTVTISFYARAGANYSPTSGNFIARLYTGTGTDQNVEVSYTGSSAIINQTATLTTTWQRFSYSGTIGTAATEFALWFAFTPTGTAGAADYAEITGVQLELGSAATPFSRSGGDIQGELAKCQRYYIRYGGVAAAERFGGGPLNNTSGGLPLIYFPVPMRIGPTAIDYTGLKLIAYDNVNGYIQNNITSITLSDAAKNTAMVNCTTAATNYTGGFWCTIQTTSISGYLGFTAEL